MERNGLILLTVWLGCSGWKPWLFTNYTGPPRTKVTQAHAGLKEKGVVGHSEEKGGHQSLP